MSEGMRAVAQEQKGIICQENGVYLSAVSLAATKQGLVCIFRRSDQHCATTTDIMITRSGDNGSTWTAPDLLAHADWQNDEAIYVAPELNRLNDGRLALIVDRGVRRYEQEWASLYHWQLPERGMSNYVFWSYDEGLSWDGPHQIDRIGGEPERIHLLSDGSLVYTATQSARRTDERVVSAKPMGSLESYAYYCNVVMASIDGGKSWEQRSVLADDQLYSDVEVGLVELAPGTLMAVSRCGDMGGTMGQPSRMRISVDYGRTWSEPTLLPFYAQRPIPGMLQSGRILITYRNFWGTSGNWAVAFDPRETLPYEPASFIWEEHRCRILDGVMVMTTGESSDPKPERGTYAGTAGAVAFACYPAEDAASRVEIEAELRVLEADIHGCCISVGCWVRFEPGRVCLGDSPEVGFELDTQQWHQYKLVRENSHLSIWVDGTLKLHTFIAGLENRYVHFGNRQSGIAHFQRNHAVSMWKSVSVSVHNRDDASIDWSWHAAQGYPDPFRRERIVCLDRNGSFFHGNSGYGGWTQLGDGTVVVADYTSGSDPVADMPFIRWYKLIEGVDI
ncbi:sialidase family protein [Paenibacillus koleovorans]|uniref:sialidase family protein n=1 Tax=Paenibacillus koleovorans TaxID=121608 RepID=UPI000FD9C648|nr:sialidase family protein [Paenibacillus koleovorans]